MTITRSEIIAAVAGVFAGVAVTSAMPLTHPPSLVLPTSSWAK